MRSSRILLLPTLLLAVAGCLYVDDDAHLVVADRDGDGFAAAAAGGADCNDAAATVHPGADEACNGRDDDCDGDVDEDLTGTFYADADGDGFGDEALASEGCSPGGGQVAVAGDCDDADPDAYPGRVESCDAVDNDCDTIVDNDPVDAFLFYADKDQDGFGDASDATGNCENSAPDGTVANGGDCNDANPAVNPGAAEACDTVDNDCDGELDEGGTAYFPDADSDGYGDPEGTSVDACTAPSGSVADGTDCDDNEASVHPGADELCDGIDQDCDGDLDEGAVDVVTLYEDVDADGFGDPGSTRNGCPDDPGWTVNSSDCDDDDIDVNPAAGEVCDNGVDDDCDGGPSGCQLDDVDTRTSLSSFSTANVGDYFGYDVTSGDFDGDGSPDVAVAAPRADGSGDTVGNVQIWYGPVDLDTPGAPDVTLWGTEDGERFGLRLGVMPDRTSDGADELLVGSWNTASQPDGGAVYVIAGGANLELSSPQMDAVIRTDEKEFGVHVGGADLTGDNVANLIVAAPSRAHRDEPAGTRERVRCRGQRRGTGHGVL